MCRAMTRAAGRSEPAGERAIGQAWSGGGELDYGIGWIGRRFYVAALFALSAMCGSGPAQDLPAVGWTASSMVDGAEKVDNVPNK